LFADDVSGMGVFDDVVAAGLFWVAAKNIRLGGLVLHMEHNEMTIEEKNTQKR